jgi:hypothetical protein
LRHWGCHPWIDLPGEENSSVSRPMSSAPQGRLTQTDNDTPKGKPT